MKVVWVRAVCFYTDIHFNNFYFTRYVDNYLKDDNCLRLTQRFRYLVKYELDFTRFQMKYIGTSPITSYAECISF